MISTEANRETSNRDPAPAKVTETTQPRTPVSPDFEEKGRGPLPKASPFSQKEYVVIKPCQCNRRKKVIAAICVCICLVLLALIIWACIRLPVDIRPQKNWTEICAKGILYGNTCYADTYSFVLTFTKNKCAAHEIDRCNVTCPEVLHHVCGRKKNLSIPLCGNDEPASNMSRFYCQPGDFFERLQDNETMVCSNETYCPAISDVYSCLAGYVRSGQVVCSPLCKPTARGTVLEASGYCVRQSERCHQIVNHLSERFSGHIYGYSYQMFDWLITHGVRWLLDYPLLMAYSVLLERRLVLSVFNTTITDFIHRLNRRGEALQNLYRMELDLVSRLRYRAEQAQRRGYVHISSDRWLHTADLAMIFECAEFASCPRYTESYNVFGVFIIRAFNSCSLAVSHVAEELPIAGRSWYESLTRTLGASFCLQNISVVAASRLFVNLHKSAQFVLAAANLQDETFDAAYAMCRIGEPVSILDEVTLPWMYRGEGLLAGSLSSFAWVLPRLRSVQKAICKTQENPPSIECELRLYLALAEFLPDPDPKELDLWQTPNRTIMYFMIRAVSRRLAYLGPTISTFSESPIKLEYHIELAAQLIDECLQQRY